MGQVLSRGLRDVPVIDQRLIDYLDSQFPENTQYIEPNKLYMQLGARSVIKRLQYLLDQAKKA